MTGFPPAAAAAPTPGVVDLWEVDLRGVPACGAGPDSEPCPGPEPDPDLDLDLDLDPGDLVLLSAEEIRRAEALVDPVQRAGFVRTRAVVRRLVGERLGCPPDQVTFTVGRYGKPTVAAAPTVHFNVSHAGGRSLVALAAGPVGVDIERTDRPVDPDRMGRLVLAPAERCRLGALDRDLRRHTFFRLWARKEAVTKGVGLGLRLPFPSVDTSEPAVTVDPARAGLDPAGCGGSADHQGPWHWVDVPVAVPLPYVAAVATAGGPPRIRLRAWSARSSSASPSYVLPTGVSS